MTHILLRVQSVTKALRGWHDAHPAKLIKLSSHRMIPILQMQILLKLLKNNMALGRKIPSAQNRKPIAIHLSSPRTNNNEHVPTSIFAVRARGRTFDSLRKSGIESAGVDAIWRERRLRGSHAHKKARFMTILTITTAVRKYCKIPDVRRGGCTFWWVNRDAWWRN